MEYVTSPNLKSPMLLNKYIGFTLEEMDLAGEIITKALEKELAKTKKRYEKYLSIQEVGEATTRQQTILYNVEQRYDDLDNLVHDLKELIDFSKKTERPKSVKETRRFLSYTHHDRYIIDCHCNGYRHHYNENKIPICFSGCRYGIQSQTNGI